MKVQAGKLDNPHQYSEEITKYRNTERRRYDRVQPVVSRPEAHTQSSSVHTVEAQSRRYPFSGIATLLKSSRITGVQAETSLLALACSHPPPGFCRVVQACTSREVALSLEQWSDPRHSPLSTRATSRNRVNGARKAVFDAMMANSSEASEQRQAACLLRWRAALVHIGHGIRYCRVPMPGRT